MHGDMCDAGQCHTGRMRCRELPQQLPNAQSQPPNKSLPQLLEVPAAILLEAPWLQSCWHPTNTAKGACTWAPCCRQQLTAFKCSWVVFASGVAPCGLLKLHIQPGQARALPADAPRGSAALDPAAAV